MISKNKLKELAAYHLQKRCDEEGAFVVEGVKMADEALAAQVHVRSICATQQWIEAHPDAVADEVLEAAPSDLERLSNMRTPNEVWMLLDRDMPNHAGMKNSQITLALDRIQDPGNLGTIMRTADWFGVRQIVCSTGTVSCFNPKVVQASMGAIFRTHVEYTDLPQWLAQCGHHIYGATLHGTKIGLLTQPVENAILLIGNESRGISDETMQYVNTEILIPNIGGTAESLNATVATGILLNWMLA